jgi:hypothetical protein
MIRKALARHLMLASALLTEAATDRFLKIVKTIIEKKFGKEDFPYLLCDSKCFEFRVIFIPPKRLSSSN